MFGFASVCRGGEERESVCVYLCVLMLLGYVRMGGESVFGREEE